MKKDKKYLKIGRMGSTINFEQIEGHFCEVASLIGEKVRAKILWNLLDGKAYTATELAIFADISRQSCSNHLLKLVNAGLLKVQKQGRHKYFQFANAEVAKVIEGIAFLIPSQFDLPIPSKPGKPTGLQHIRTCYDHLAGKIAVDIHHFLLENEIILNTNDQFSITTPGQKWIKAFGIDLQEVTQMKRKFAYPCLDWSERKPHLGGALGAAFLQEMLKKDWVRKKQDSRSLVVTSKGKQEFWNTFKINVADR